VDAEVDVIVVGGGVVGLAAAAALARAGRAVALLERHAGFGREASSRNSEVIHAGLYHPPGSLKAALCVEGRRALYARCERLAIPHRRLGQLVVASDGGEAAALGRLLVQGRANGAGELRLLEPRELPALEPSLRGRRRCSRPRAAASTRTPTACRMRPRPRPTARPCWPPTRWSGSSRLRADSASRRACRAVRSRRPVAWRW
jgi:L-2-hydroxyglutarate oxidase LhgO